MRVPASTRRGCREGRDREGKGAGSRDHHRRVVSARAVRWRCGFSPLVGVTDAAAALSPLCLLRCGRVKGVVDQLHNHTVCAQRERERERGRERCRGFSGVDRNIRYTPQCSRVTYFEGVNFPCNQFFLKQQQKTFIGEIVIQEQNCK